MPRLAMEMVADSSKWRSEITAGSAAVREAQKVVEDAKNRIRQSFLEQVAAAKSVGASSQELAAIVQRTAQMRADAERTGASQIESALQSADSAYMRSVAARRALAAQDRANQAQAQADNASATRAFESRNSAELAALRQQIEQRAALAGSRAQNAGASFGSGLANLNGYSGEARRAADAVQALGEAHGHAVPPMAAASGALRVMEGNVQNNIRAAERFLTTTLGLGPILEAAFPVIGAVALGGALFEMGKKAFDAIQNIVMLKTALNDLDQAELDTGKAVRSAQDETETSVESILEQTQGRGAAARQRLTYQSAKNVDLGDFFTSKAVTSLPDDVKGQYEQRYKNVAPDQVSSALDRLTKERNGLQARLDAVNGRGPDAARAAFGSLPLAVDGTAPSSTRDLNSYYEARLKLNQQTADRLAAAADSRSARVNQLQVAVPVADKEDSDKAAQKVREAQQKALAAQRQAQTQQRQQWEEEHSEWELAADRSSEDEAFFWFQRADQAAKGSENYLQAMQKESEAIRQMRRDTRTKEKENDRTLDEMGRDYDKSSAEEGEKGLQHSGSGVRDWIAAQQQALQVQQEMRRAIEDTSIQRARETGYLTEQQAAELQRQLAAERYMQDRAKLEADLAGASDRSRYTSDDAQKTAQTLAQTALVKLDAERARAVIQEEAKLAG